MFCSACGKEIAEDSGFCPYCGASVAQAAAAPQGPAVPPPSGPVPPPPAGPVPPPPPGQGTAAPGGAPPAPPPAAAPRKSSLPWIAGILGVLLAAGVAAVLVLGFAAGPKWFAGDSGPEEVVKRFFSSLEKKDARMMLGTMEPAFVEQMEPALGADYIELIQENFFTYFPDKMEFKLTKMDTKLRGDRATVRILEGTLSYIDEDGEKVVEEASETDLVEFELLKVEGKWYLSGDTLIDMGFDFDNGGDEPGEDGDPRGKERAGAGSPEEAVRGFFAALERKDVGMMLGTMEPAFVEQMASYLGEDYFDILQEGFFSVFPDELEFKITKVDTEMRGNRATVRVLEGTVAFIDEYGERVVEELSDSDPAEFELVKVDGKWYLSGDTLLDMGFDFSDDHGDLDWDYDDLDWD